MTETFPLSTKHGFTIQEAAPDSPAVQYYRADHLAHYGYPADVELSSTHWFGICKEGKVYGVVGVRVLSEKIVEVPDFFFQRSRLGVLAAYAAMEIIKQLAEQLQIEIITATPVWNKNQMRAMERVFGLGPTHHVYRYRPWEKPDGR